MSSAFLIRLICLLGWGDWVVFGADERADKSVYQWALTQ